jgi:hypothetical protein
MREQKTFSIEGHNDKTFKVKELTLREWLDILSPGSFEGKDLFAFFKHFQFEILPKATNIKPKELLEMVPSEIDIVWGHFKEVNKTFFGLADRLGLKSMFEEVRPHIFAAFGGYVVDWLSQAMSGPQTTDSATSSTPSTSTKPSDSKSLPSPPTPQESASTQMKSPGRSSSETAVSEQVAEVVKEVKEKAAQTSPKTRSRNLQKELSRDS